MQPKSTRVEGADIVMKSSAVLVRPSRGPWTKPSSGWTCSALKTKDQILRLGAWQNDMFLRLGGQVCGTNVRSSARQNPRNAQRTSPATCGRYLPGNASGKVYLPEVCDRLHKLNSYRPFAVLHGMDPTWTTRHSRSSPVLWFTTNILRPSSTLAASAIAPP